MVAIPPQRDGNDRRRRSRRAGRHGAGGAREDYPAPTPAPVPNLPPMPDNPAPLPDQRRGPDPGPRGSRRLSRVRGGSRLLGVRVSAIVALELVAAALLLFRPAGYVGGSVIVVVAIAIAALALVPFRGMRLGSWLAGAVAYSSRRRVTSSGASGRELAPTGDPAPSGNTDDPERVVVPPDVAALFPGISVRTVTNRQGGRIGLVQWQGRWLALLSVTAPESDLLETNDALQIPVDAMLKSLVGQGFELDAVQIVTQSLHGNVRRFGGGAIEAIAGEHRAVGALERGRDTWITVRIDPASAAAPIAIRGGGVDGLGRLAAAAISRIEAQATLAGLVVRALDAPGAMRAMAASLLQPDRPTGRAGERPVRWIESWRSFESSQAQHRCFAVKSWHQRGLQQLPLTDGYGVTVAHEIRRAGDGVSVMSVIRVTAASRSSLDRASDELRAACRPLGVGLRVLRGQQASAFRLTVPAGRR